VRYLVLAVACSLAVLTYVQRQGFVAGTPDIKRDLELNDREMGYLASVWLVAYGLFQVPGGLLGDRLGARHVLTLLVLAWSLTAGAVAVAAFLPPGSLLAFGYLIIFRFLFGAFQAGGFPVLARVIADWMPAPQRGFAQGMVWTCSRLGGALAPLIVLWLIRFYGDWSTPIWLIAALGLLWCAFFWPWFRNRPSDMAQVNEAERALIEDRESQKIEDRESRIKDRAWKGEAEETRIKAQQSSILDPQSSIFDPRSSILDPHPPTLDPPASILQPRRIGWSEFLGSVNVWALCLMYGFVGFAGNFITSLLPIYLRDHRKLSPHETAWLSGLPLACGIVSCLLGGVLSDWLIRRFGSRTWGRRLVGCTVLALAGLAVLSSIWVDEVWLLALAFSASFFFSDANMGPAWASCADVGERYAGTLSGAMNMTGAFFGAAGMAFAGTCFHEGLDEIVFIVFAISYGAAALCWLAVDVTRPLVPDEKHFAIRSAKG
jgi:sugar phosphate permease